MGMIWNVHREGEDRPFGTIGLPGTDSGICREVFLADERCVALQITTRVFAYRPLDRPDLHRRQYEAEIIAKHRIPPSFRFEHDPAINSVRLTWKVLVVSAANSEDLFDAPDFVPFDDEPDLSEVVAGTISADKITTGTISGTAWSTVLTDEISYRMPGATFATPGLVVMKGADGTWLKFGS